jgi:ferredoxin
MFSLKLNGRHCISCGICMDVCRPRAIAMRTNRSRGVEGETLTYLDLRSASNVEPAPEPMMTFPYLAYPDLCDGCALCVNECPVVALELKTNEFAFRADGEFPNNRTNDQQSVS